MIIVMHNNYYAELSGLQDPCSNTIAGLNFALAMWVPYIHDNLQLFNSETYIHEYSVITRCFSVYACGQVLFRSGSDHQHAGQFNIPREVDHLAI